MKYRVDTTKGIIPFNHYWEKCVGSCHAATALRSDYREQLQRAHEELGFEYVRFHGLFDDDMSVVLSDAPSPYIPSDKVKYNFMNIDNIFDFLISIGMKPFIEIGFMPKLLASGDSTAFSYEGNITEPKDFGQWSHFIESFIRHLEERYGETEVKTWFFEVWNEPNLEHFWKGTMESYFKLYECTVRAVKKVNADYQTGGPATSINAWIPELRQFCEANNVPLDFISTHHYPTDDPLWSNPDIDLMQLMSEKGMDVMNKYDKHIMRKMTQRARQESGELPLYYTEWNISALLGDVEHDTTYASAMIARILHENSGLAEGYSYWTFTDIFEEMGQMPGEFHGGFGLQTYHGIRKPSYRLFELFHKMGTKQYQVESESTDEKNNIGVLATENKDKMSIIVYNHNTKAMNDIKTEQLTLSINTFSDSVKVNMYRIDETHANAREVWEEMGEPTYVDKRQLTKLNRASEIQPELTEIISREGSVEISVELPPYSVAYLEVQGV